MRLSVEQYHAMIRNGILGDDDAIELLEGWLVEKMTKDTKHIASTRRIRRRLERLVPDSWLVDSQEPVTTADSEPEPDAMVVRGSESDFDTRKVEARDVGLVVEVSESSLHRDRTQKKRIYAAAGIPIYWIINVVDRQLEVFSNPSPKLDSSDATYMTEAILREGDVASVMLDGKDAGEISVSEMLPPSEQ